MTLEKLKRPKVHVSFGKAEGGGRASVSRRGEARPGQAGQMWGVLMWSLTWRQWDSVTRNLPGQTVSAKKTENWNRVQSVRV